MKMIAKDGDTQYLKMLKERLEEKGIPAVIQGENTARMIIPFFLFEPTLWVYMDDQFHDAEQLIMNPGHVVTTGIDVDAFYDNQPTEIEQRNELNHALIHLALFSGAIIFALFVFIKVFGKV